MAKFNGKRAGTDILSVVIGGAVGFFLGGPIGAALGAVGLHAITAGIEF